MIESAFFFSHLDILKRYYCFLCQVRSGGPAICDETQHVTAIIDVDGATICDKTQHVTAIIDVDGATICDENQHVTTIIDIGGATICDETQHVTAITDVDGAPVVEPTHSSGSGHLQSKLSTCPYCRLQFMMDRELCDHIRTQHADRRYACQRCSCTFARTGGLNRHVRNIHQKLVKCSCGICGKGYHDRRDYHDHVATHAGAKRNVCTICQAQLIFERSLKVHVMRFHRDAIESSSHS